MTKTIYRKYRPKNFTELIGQNHVKITIENQISTGNIAHAYLFTGPRGVGKTTTARLLAASVNAGDNVNVEAILKGKDIDVIEIDAASNTSVDNVRENIIENSRFTPNIRKFKVFIIDEVHMLSIQAFNALLKILEEPPVNTIFILATTELHKLPATIVSRCQRFDFKKISSKDIVERLNSISKQESISVEESVLYDIARHAQGCMRDAESLFGQVLTIGEKHVTKEMASIVLPSSHFDQVVDLLVFVANKNTADAIIYINENLNHGIDINQFFVDLLEILRKILILKITNNLNHYSFELSDELEKKIIELSTKFSQNQILRMIDIFAKKRLDVKNAILPHMPLELAVVEYIDLQTSVNNESQPIVDNKKKLLEPKNEVFNKVQKAKVENTPELQSQDKTVGLKENVIAKEILNEGSVVSIDDCDECNVNIEDVKIKWVAFLSELQKENPSIVLILKSAEPSEIVDGVLKIGYKFAFHRDKIMNGALYDVLLKTFRTFIGKIKQIEGYVLSSGYVSEFIQEITADDDVEFIADATVQDNTTSLVSNADTQKETKPEDLINNLVQAFGGRIVD